MIRHDQSRGALGTAIAEPKSPLADIAGDALSIRSLIEERAKREPEKPYLRYGEQRITFRALDARVNALANGIAALLESEDDRVAVMLPNHPDAVYAFFALAKLGVIQVPVNVQLKGASLEYLLDHSDPSVLLADRAYAGQLAPLLRARPRLQVIWRDAEHRGRSTLHELLETGSASAPRGAPLGSDVLSIMYTSGTTGPPKGVQVTDKMHRIAAYTSALVADARPGDVFYIWEPIYHISATEVLILGLAYDVTLALAPGFSASRFWDDALETGATQMHYLGGVLQILCRRPPSERDRAHSIRIAWGGGAPVGVWREFEQRFGIRIRENYGMTEASSLTSFNLDGVFGSVGRPVPFFDVRIFSESDVELGTNETGEIRVREREPGSLTPGYFRNPEASARALVDGWLRTGDLGRFDENGNLYYAGRLKDSVRRRGENVSAWEVERVIEQLDGVEECALIGVPDELGDEELKLFVRPAEGTALDAHALFRACDEKLPRFQVPRFIAFVEVFEKTATQRIKKEALAKDIAGCWSRDRAGKVVPPEIWNPDS